MDPLQQAAKNNNLKEFRRLWYKENNIDPLKDKTDYNAQITRDFAYYKDGGGKIKTGGDSGLGKGNMMEGLVGMIQSQESVDYLPMLSEELINVSDVYQKIVDSQGKLNSATEIGKNIMDGAIGQLGLYAKQQTGLLDVVNRQAGMTGLMAKDFREELTNANPRLLQLGIGFNELANAAKQLVDQSGRFATINQQSFERAGEIAKAYVGNLSELVAMYPEFEKVGLGAADAQERIGKAGYDAIGLGLQSQKVTKELSSNIGKLNEFGFKNGVDGLSAMVRKATEFRMSMDSVFQVAEKVFEPDQAIELSANLQVLGGAIGDFNDPMKLMYMATNNVEGLQDALIGAASSLTTYNQEQGRFEITGVNLRRAREMAKQLGVDYKELAKGAVAAAERSAAASDLMARGLSLSKEQQEFITNIAQMKDGKMQIEINSERLKKALNIEGNTVALEKLTDDQAKTLLKYQEDFKNMSPEDVVRQQATSIENMKRDVNYIASLLRIQAGRTGEAVMNAMSEAIVGGSPEKLAEATLNWTKNSNEDIKGMSKSVIATVEEMGKSAKGSKTNSQNQPSTADLEAKMKKEKEKTDDSKNKPAAPSNNPIQNHQFLISFPWGYNSNPVAEHKGSFLRPH